MRAIKRTHLYDIIYDFNNSFGFLEMTIIRKKQVIAKTQFTRTYTYDELCDLYEQIDHVDVLHILNNNITIL